jgi:hypothetical protein
VSRKVCREVRFLIKPLKTQHNTIRAFQVAEKDAANEL